MSLLGMHAKLNRKEVVSHHRDLHLFLKEHPAGVLATVTPDGSPYASTIYYSIDSSLTATFVTKRDTEKSNNLTHNNKATLVVFDVARQTTAQLTGCVQEITDADEANQAFRGTLRASLHEGRTAVPPIAKLNAGKYVAYRFMPERIRYASYGPPQVEHRHKMFETIDLPL